MMNKNDFLQYIADNVKEYLPKSYEDALIQIEKNFKKNDQALIGVSIKKAEEHAAPIIYLDNAYKLYQNGKDLDELVGEVADKRIEYEDMSSTIYSYANRISDYENVKDTLSIVLCDTEENQKRLEKLVSSQHGDLSAIYNINIYVNENTSLETSITPSILENWGISFEQLQKDALKLDLSKGAQLLELSDVVMFQITGKQPKNILETQKMEELPLIKTPLYCLTNNSFNNGSTLIMQDDLLKQIGEIMGNDFYVLPSSIHETLLCPKTEPEVLEDLSDYIRTVNATEVHPAEKLSDKVQYYDRTAGVLENAQNRFARLEKERTQKQNKTIHSRLAEKKEANKKQKHQETTKNKNNQLAL